MLVDEDFYNHDVILVVIDGMDTFTILEANNMEYNDVINMFMRYSFSIKGVLHIGDNVFNVRFIPSEREATAWGETPTNKYPILPECPNLVHNGICYGNRIRKMQSSYSSSWGPAVASMGVW